VATYFLNFRTETVKLLSELTVKLSSRPGSLGLYIYIHSHGIVRTVGSGSIIRLQMKHGTYLRGPGQVSSRRPRIEMTGSDSADDSADNLKLVPGL